MGADLLPEVRRLLASAEGLRPLAQSLARARRGCCRSASCRRRITGCCRCCRRDFGARYPRVRLQLAEATSDVQIEELVAGRIDAGLVIAPLPPRHGAQLSYLPIAREPLVIAMSSELAARVGAARIDATDATADASTDATRDAGARRMHDIPVSLRDVADAPLVNFSEASGARLL